MILYVGWTIRRQGEWWTAVKADRPEALRAKSWRQLKEMIDGADRRDEHEQDT